MTGRLEGKTALVMGAGSIGPGWGNGKAAAVLFAREGAKVYCVDINEAAAKETAEIIVGEGGDAEHGRADVADAQDVARVVSSCVDRFGRIDALHNNVGIVEVGGVVELPEETWDHVLNVNLKSCYLAMKNVIPVMVGQGGGSIVNISSIASIRFTGVPYATYYASKAAMNHLTRVTAVEYAAQGVTFRPHQCDPAWVDEDPDGGEIRAAGEQLCGRRRRRDVAGTRRPGANGAYGGRVGRRPCGGLSCLR